MKYHTNGLLRGIISFLYACANNSSIVLVGYSLLGLSFSSLRVSAEENILVIHGYKPELASTKQNQLGIEQGFAELKSQSRTYHEFLNSSGLMSAQDEQKFAEYLKAKYRRIDLDLMMVVEEPSLNFILRQHQQLFPKLPVVFLGVEELSQKMLDTSWLTGVVEDRSLAPTVLEAAKETWANTAVIINDTGENSKINLEKIAVIKQASQQSLRQSLKIEVVNDLAPEDVKTRLGVFPPSVPIIMLGQLYESREKQNLIDPSLDAQILSKLIPNPIYTDNEVRLGNGVLGGKIFDVNYHLRQGVELAHKILQGAKPDQVGPFFTGKNRWIFDYRRLLKHNIKLELLPPDSELLYVEQPLYIKYRPLVLVVGLILCSSFLAIILLLRRARKRELANQILQENEQRYKDLAEAGANVFWELDKHLKYSYISGSTEDLCGLEPSAMKGHYPPLLHQNNARLDVDWELFKRITKTRQPFKNFTFSLKDQNQGVRIFKINGNPLFDEHHNFVGYRGVKQEITAEQNLYQQIAYQAAYDDLTGLINRREFNQKLEYSVQKAQKYNTESVLCYLDLDRFKIVNDTAGHLVGDRLLAELAQLLKGMIRKEDTLGRLGGDEFGLLLEGCSIKEAELVCEQLIRAINNYRLQWKNLEFDVGVSVGMVGICQDATDATELLSRADLACYQAKNRGRGRVYIVENNDQELDLQQTQMSHVANVSQAIKEKRFYLVKQLIKPIGDRGEQRNHYELLLRLKDPSGNSIAPEAFIPVAERYGVITIVDRWVLEASLKSYQQYFAAQRDLVSINLSGASINDERFTNFAIDLIKKSQVPGDCLCFEITETAAIAQMNHAQKFMMAMKELGVKFALDDFGSGLSSFSYLKNLPIDYLKIDGSLVKAIPNEEYDRAIVTSINEVAHLMGIKTIAEFVETDQILEHISKISIDYAQGYITGKPMAIAS
jgi:diguanylate cyclase (GGDEF)-like protein/PAS domain S-box-containing protein